MPEQLVLILDDDPNLVRLSQRMLENAGYRALAADDPQQAMAVLEHYPINALLVGARIPGMDCYKYLAEARRRRPELTVVVIAGYGSIDAAVLATRRGADSILLKNFQEKELVETVSLAIENSVFRRDGMRLRALQPVFQVVEALFSVTDLAVLPALAVEQVHPLFDSAFTALYQLDEAAHYRLIASVGPVPDLQTCFDLFGRNKTYLNSVSRWGSKEASENPHIQAVLQCMGMADILCVGEVSRQGSAGVLMVISRRPGQALFSHADHDSFVILARQVALALENAALYTDLRRSVQEIEHSQQAMLQVDKMATIGRLTASIAHEINNPLQGLQNWLQLAGRKDLPRADRQRYLALGQEELNRLQQVVQRMLDFYRPGLRDKRLVDVNDLVHYVLSLLDVQLVEAHIGTQLFLDQKLPPVMAVATQIQQVLLNLMINAMQAMPAGGEIHIRTGRVNGFAAGSFARPRVEIIVEDTGPGVVPLVRERLFEPFVSTKDQGTGLGLPMCYGIITAHGGTLELIPGNSVGACFRITLPEDEG